MSRFISRRVPAGIALLTALALVAAACAGEDSAAQDAAAAASNDAAVAAGDASAAMASAQGAQAGADAADARAAAAEAEAAAAKATADAAAAAADAAVAAAGEAQAAAELAQATASGSAAAIAEAEAALADAQAAAEAASEQAAAAQTEAAAAQAEAAAAQTEAAAAQAEAAAAQTEAAAAQAEAAAAQAQVDEMEAAAAAEVYMSPGAGVSVTQARATWTTGYMQAAIYHHLLEELGYDVSEPAERELANDIFYVALAEGEVDFWANGWLPGHRKFFEAELSDGTIVAQKVEVVGWEIPAAGLEGLLTNKEIATEYGIKTIGQINDDPELIALYDATDTSPGDGVVQILVCPDGWTCDDIFAETIEFNGWDNLEAVRAGYDAMFAEAVAKVADGDPVIVYTWSPSGYLTRLIPGDNVVWLSVGGVENVLDGSTTSAFDFNDFPPAALGPEYCTNDPCYTGFAAADIRVVANNDFLAANPAARSLFESVTLSVIDIALQNVRFDDGENTTADVNRHAAEWIEANRAKVDEWLTTARDAA
jgi:glycine betaine/proline transport system substrate-binding protein